MVENEMKTLVWMIISLCVFDKMKTEAFEMALVGAGPEPESTAKLHSLDITLLPTD